MVDNAGNYLGILTNWGRSKRATLGYIKERVMRKLHEWKSLFLTAVLIKAVITAILTYLMTLFKLPSTWCKEIAKMIARFWWNERDGQRTMHWISWKKITMPKDMGGFRFRDLGYFNTAMLTKTTRRLHDNPTSLWAQVMKGMYYPKTNLLEETKGVRPSWA